MTEKKPSVKLVGTDGNVFSLLAVCKKAGRRAGMSKEELNKFQEEVTSSDSYEEALSVMMRWFDVS